MWSKSRFPQRSGCRSGCVVFALRYPRRLDGVLSAAFPLSRAGAAQAVAGGRVSLNDICCLKPEKQLAPGDVIALRGRGKLRVLSLDGETKKGRQALTIGIYE